MHDHQRQRNAALPGGERPAWALAGPGIAALTGLYLLTMPFGPAARVSLQVDLGLSSQTALLTTLVAYLVSAAAGGALGVGLGGRSLTTVSMTAVALMIIGVLLNALAPGTGIYLTGRVLSGLGAGGVVGATVAVARRAGRRWGALVAILAGLGVLALILGPLINQGLSSALSWRWGYLITLLPLVAGLIATAVSGFVLLLTPRPAQPNAAGMPYPPAEQRPWNAPPET
ncbi:MFS transporter [Nonomuraea turkmeniaca]|uniref:MFS transporter n=1 Tax=Nonomuraea turkmeniaca TaxID=103838 RepID=A0A5S4FQB2_9ACTN|nr:MFS transporter [Nonomuraea turkmeniaca]TMR22896.1 MFS transporter [Nonomuraea turkmeniaca]